MRKVTAGGASAALFARVMTTAHWGPKPAPMRRANLVGSWLTPDLEDMLEEEGFEFPPIDPSSE